MNPTLFGITAANRTAIVDGMARLAAEAGLSPIAFWNAAVEHWAPAPIVTDATLAMDVIKFTAMLNTPVIDRCDTGGTNDRPAPRRRARTHKRGVPRELDDRTRKVFWTKPDVHRLWDAASAAIQLHGVCFNALIIIETAEAPDLVHEAGQFMRRNGAGPLHYILQHHHTAEHGAKSLIVCHIPPHWADEVSYWIENHSERRFGTQRAMTAVRVSITRHEQAQDRLRRHWRLIRLLGSMLDPGIEIVAEGHRRPLIELLRVPFRLRSSSLSQARAQRFRVSETIGAGARTKAQRDLMPLLSAFADQAWPWLSTGWELQEYEDRRLEVLERVKAVALIEAQWPAGRNERLDQIRSSRLDELQASWRQGGQQRHRSWRGWWT